MGQNPSAKHAVIFVALSTLFVFLAKWKLKKKKTFNIHSYLPHVQIHTYERGRGRERERERERERPFYLLRAAFLNCSFSFAKAVPNLLYLPVKESTRPPCAGSENDFGF